MLVAQRRKLILIGMAGVLGAVAAWPAYSRTSKQVIAPMQRRAWGPTQGGGRIAIGNLVLDRSVGAHVPIYVNGQIELAVQRQIKLPQGWDEASLFRLSVYLARPGSGCCGGRAENGNQEEFLGEVHGEPFLMAPGEWINDVVPVNMPCLPGRYKAYAIIEEYGPPTAERGETWGAHASKSYEIDVR